MKLTNTMLATSLAVCSAMTVLVGCADMPTGSYTTQSQHAVANPLRIVAANITSGNQQSYQTPGERILQSIQADIGLIQEFNVGGNSDAEIKNFVKAAFGPTYDYVRGAPSQIPNGIVTRYPILHSGEWIDPMVSNRTFVWAQIDIPGDADLWAVSLHLLTSSANNRQREAAEVVRNLKARVPAGDHIVIGGDFNTRSRTEQALSEFSKVVDAAGPFPTDPTGNGNTNQNRNKPYDWVLVDGALESKEMPAAIGQYVMDNGAVVDTRAYQDHNAIAPAERQDSAAPMMQHMAVVRDFELN